MVAAHEVNIVGTFGQIWSARPDVGPDGHISTLHNRCWPRANNGGPDASTLTIGKARFCIHLLCPKTGLSCSPTALARPPASDKANFRNLRPYSGLQHLKIPTNTRDPAAAMSPTADVIATADTRGNIYVLRVAKNRYRLLVRSGKPVVAMEVRCDGLVASHNTFGRVTA